ncbi:MAG: hypothetical protein M1834_009664 [Cirrosporium novae-zelandiae]|nr:MAG: hypothetical protein M1834_009664 [Cirrosporium novae-zelandiae]
MGLKTRNPIGFTPLPVTFITSIIYIALLIIVLVVHNVLPSTPKNSPNGIDLIEAWSDLQTLSKAFHPFNSPENDNIRNWLLGRVESILQDNNVSRALPDANSLVTQYTSNGDNTPVVFLFNDIETNTTFSQDGSQGTDGRSTVPAISHYFESLNIIVYIRGTEDDQSTWWEEKNGEPKGKGGVLVNAHFDSVSTGYGTTDDGMGVITVLQLLKYFTTPGNQPKKGLVILLNNGEEDGLYGAKVFPQHPMSKFPHTFLNLEGAGAGGRALLFRSTDTEVTKFYQKARYPFASVLTADGFKRGLLRSQTDYAVFYDQLGMRGLDVAFMEPRARYHTDEDDIRHASMDSLWHMLSASIAVTRGMTSDSSSRFEGSGATKGKINSGKGTDGVWFDLFGSAFVIFRLHTMFAISVTLLVATPFILFTMAIFLVRADKAYMFTSNSTLQSMRGFFRYPLIIVIATAVNIGLAYLITKVNPYIVHSSEYSVWAMMFTAWLFVAWLISRSADFIRPSALHRAYSFFWLYLFMWILLVNVTVYENNKNIAGGYFIVFYFAAVFLAFVISLSELFFLPSKSEYLLVVSNRGTSRPASRSVINGDDSPSGPSATNNEDTEEEADETTSLLQRTTFANYVTRTEDSTDEVEGAYSTKEVFGNEQSWSFGIPKWTWLLQFILVAPIAVILLSQVGLLVTSAMHQTGADGNSVLTVYLLTAVLSALMLAPLAPFLHRYTYHIPLFLLLVLIGTSIYNLSAFPFSQNHRLKLFFMQTVDLDSGINEVILTGINSPLLREATESIPSAFEKPINCLESTRGKVGLYQCAWKGLPPKCGLDQDILPPESTYHNWLSYNVSRVEDRNEALIEFYGRNTRACRINFDSPISEFKVDGGSSLASDRGIEQIQLWSRTWEKTWKVNVKWKEGGGINGKLTCLWSDQNKQGAIPALEEVRHNLPVWATATKLSAGLVEGSKVFMV